MGARLVAGFLAIVLSGGAVAAAGPASDAPWVLPKADAETWAERVRKLTPPGWTVSPRSNDIIIQRNEPVRFHRDLPNQPNEYRGQERKPDLHEGVFRLTLRFAPKMSIDEYEKLAAENATSDREQDQLRQAVRLTYKADSFDAKTPEERERVRTYREAVKKLTWHTLPDLYTPDFSIHLLLPGDGWSYVYDKDVAAECLGVQEALLRYFGMYNPKAAARGRDVGRHESPAKH